MGKFYITTPIFYVNGDPHLGTAYAAITADALARWHRFRGDEVLYVTGTDEHGLKIAQTAEAHGVTPQEWVDGTSAHFEGAWRELDISFDDFVRTTQPRHVETVQHFLSVIHDNGYIYLGSYQGLYCVGCEAYYTEEELEENLCPVHHTPVMEMEEENYFFALSQFQDRLIALYENTPEKIFPESRRNEVLSFLRGGLQDISITRTSLKWGVEVPWDANHVFYVWFDALINYLTAIGYDHDAQWESWWENSYHLLGKDILRFHAVWWPAMCMAAGFEPPHKLLVSGWMLVGGKKMAKSAGNQIDPLTVARQLGREPLRYYLLRANAFGPDGDVSLEALHSVYRSDLANDLGNLVSRVAAVITTKAEGKAPPVPKNPPEVLDFRPRLTRAVNGWDSFNPQDALEATMELVRATNVLLETVEPWRKGVNDPESLVALGSAIEVIRVVAVLIAPVMPDTSVEIARRIGRAEIGLEWSFHEGGQEILRHEPLFPRDRGVSKE